MRYGNARWGGRIVVGIFIVFGFWLFTGAFRCRGANKFYMFCCLPKAWSPLILVGRWSVRRRRRRRPSGTVNHSVSYFFKQAVTTHHASAAQHVAHV